MMSTPKPKACSKNRIVCCSVTLTPPSDCLVLSAIFDRAVQGGDPSINERSLADDNTSSPLICWVLLPLLPTPGMSHNPGTGTGLATSTFGLGLPLPGSSDLFQFLTLVTFLLAPFLEPLLACCRLLVWFGLFESFLELFKLSSSNLGWRSGCFSTYSFIDSQNWDLFGLTSSETVLKGY